MLVASTRRHSLFPGHSSTPLSMLRRGSVKAQEIKAAQKQRRRSSVTEESLFLTAQQEKELAAEQLALEREFRRRESVEDAYEFLKTFVHTYFSTYEDYIQVDISMNTTLDHVKMIGNIEDQCQGVRACRRLFNAPVLSDQVGLKLYHVLRKGEDDTIRKNSGALTKEAEEEMYRELEETKRLFIRKHSVYCMNSDESPSHKEPEDPLQKATDLAIQRQRTMPDPVFRRRSLEVATEGLRRRSLLMMGSFGRSLALGYNA